jgi:hypothetical protein
MQDNSWTLTEWRDHWKSGDATLIIASIRPLAAAWFPSCEDRHMSEDITIKSNGKGMRIFNKIPYAFLLIIYMLVVRFTGLDMGGMTGYIFIGLCLIVLIVEFFKSGDISTAYFLSDIVFAVLAVVVATALMSYLMFKLGETPTFYYWLGYAVIIGDAVISPFNSFRTALRNFGVGS